MPSTPRSQVYQTAAGPPQPVTAPHHPTSPPPTAGPPAGLATDQSPGGLPPVTPPLPTRTPGEHAFPPQPATERSLPTRTPGETALPHRSAEGGPPPEPAEPTPTHPPDADGRSTTRPPRQRQRQPGVPVFGDLIGPATVPAQAPAEPADAGGDPAAGRWPPGPPFEQRPEPGQPYQPGPGQFAGGGHPGGSQQLGYADGPPVAANQPYIPPQRTEQSQAAAEAPAAPPAAEIPAEPPPSKGGPPTILIVGAVMIGATLLVLGALSIPFLLQQLSTREVPVGYSVGDCVVQDGQNARVADCGVPGAYEIVAETEQREECDDPTQPAIEVAGPPARFYCLTPATAGLGDDPSAGDTDQDESPQSDE